MPNALPPPTAFAPLPTNGVAPNGSGGVDTQLVSVPFVGLVSNTGAYVVDSTNGTTLNVNTLGVVTGGTTSVTVLGSPAQGSFDKGAATLQQSGSDAATGIYWGRWGSEYTITVAGVSATSTANGPNHVMYSTHVTTPAELDVLKAAASGPNANPQVVNATYNYVGGTSPSRSDGALGSVNSMTVKANFSSQMITAYDVNLKFPAGSSAQVWDAHLDPAKASSATFANFSGTGASALGGSPGIGLAGTCTGCANGNAINGSARGLFTGNDARGLMTSFQLQNGNGGVIVNGTGALKR